jgi:hypothetical protein
MAGEGGDLVALEGDDATAGGDADGAGMMLRRPRKVYRAEHVE